jgi:Sporulation and spore germination/Putative peptidoglycan binding domain/L,D-transpeptidase catalytic domain
MNDGGNAGRRPGARRGSVLVRRVAAGGVLLILASALAVTVATAAPAAQPRVSVYFVQGEQLVPVSRPGATALAAVRQLLAGPTRTEYRDGFRTYVPAATRIRSVSVANRIATVDLTAPFAGGADPETMLARLSELVHTLTGLQGATKVRLLVAGASTAGMFPGVSTGNPITLRFLETPNVPVPKPPELRLPAPDAAVKIIQQRLIALGYLLPGDDDGRFGPATSNAILAFQKWERLDRTGLLDSVTKARLAAATHPVPITHGGAGKRAEILLDRQVALLIDNDAVVRTIAVSSGKASTPTPPGDYHVYAKITRWWSVPFREWLPYALPFVGGIAFHEFGDVPAYPASHGCVRQSSTVAPWTYAFAYVGMPVKVIAQS